MAPIRCAASAGGAAVLLASLAACGSADAPAIGSGPSGLASPSAAPSVAGPTAPVTALNRLTPHGPLSTVQLRALVIDFEDRLSAAYAAGDTSQLNEFLAGPELTGIAATIAQLDTRHQRNIFHVAFDLLSITKAAADEMIFHLVVHTTDNHFVDVDTNQVLNQGYPGPQAEAFTMYFSYNPADHAWYWTGAKNVSPQ